MALRSYQRVLIGLAGPLGIIPVPHAWRHRLLRADGEFRRSAQDLGFRLAFEIILIGTGSYGAFDEFRSYTPGNGNALFYGALCLAMVAIGLALVSSNRVRYRFAGGSVAALTGRGKVLWQENLADLKDVLYTRGRINSFITLVWPHRRRRIELYDSLRRELSSPSIDGAGLS